MAHAQRYSRLANAQRRAQQPVGPSRHFVDHELVHARKIAFLGTLAYVLVVFLAVNAAFGWSLWPWLPVIALCAIAVGLILAMLPNRD